MFYVLENMNFKRDPKHCFYTIERYSSQRAVTVQRVDNTHLSVINLGAGAAAGRQPPFRAGPGAPSIPRRQRGGKRGRRLPAAPGEQQKSRPGACRPTQRCR